MPLDGADMERENSDFPEVLGMSTSWRKSIRQLNP
jgi:hypothetical protein